MDTSGIATFKSEQVIRNRSKEIVLYVQCLYIEVISRKDVQMKKNTSKTERLDIRITAKARQLLQQAAAERHTTISQFVLESALNSANTVLAERSRIRLNAEQWAAFMEALDAPLRSHPRMERLLNEPSILD